MNYDVFGLIFIPGFACVFGLIFIPGFDVVLGFSLSAIMNEF